ncbi:hypothetical protein [Actinomadura sp. DC4]|uniref:hypothetical protein n=1 Tax=Actinomadura sp. DC4 TaxID=3055069 RepID=UPI0025AF7C7C|nr:hypothetical protein [Actinomadura sp. DC4]MDN3353860.1 hypothetical protein [Actinomadura sp. DC4]
MGMRRALGVLAEQWDDIRERIGPEDAGELSALVVEFVGEGDGDMSKEIAEEIVGLLRGRLPLDHPFRQAVIEDERRLAPDRAVELASWFRLTEPLRGLVGEPAPTASQVMADGSAWLLAADAFTAAEVRVRGQDPDDPGLIRLDRDDGIPQWPSFQFGPDGTPPQVVRTVNRILLAEEDPFGAADWWLGENAWLHAVPAHSIGSLPDESLIAAARAMEAEA